MSNPESILFKGVDIIAEGSIRQGDLLVKNGKIAAFDWILSASAELTIKDRGLTLMPGVIDPHVHVRDPGLTWKEDLESGSKAAAFGGVTTFFDMPNTNPPCTSQAAVDAKHAIAAEKSLVNASFFMGGTADNLDALIRAKNVPGIKLYLGSTTGDMSIADPTAVERIFEKVPHLIAVHSEDDTIIEKNRHHITDFSDPTVHYRLRSVEAALSMTQKTVAWAEQHGSRLHICHLTTTDEATFLATKRMSGRVTSEVSPQHLRLFGPDIYDRIGNFAKINPPIRDARHAIGLLKALKSGWIDLIATDHAPHTIDEKSKPYLEAHAGMPGLETSLPLMLDWVNAGEFSLVDLVRWMCEGPARVFNVMNKGKIQVGFDADLVLVDLAASRTLKNADVISKCGWSAFEGMTLKGHPIATFVNGKMVYREGHFFQPKSAKPPVFAPPKKRVSKT